MALVITRRLCGAALNSRTLSVSVKQCNYHLFLPNVKRINSRYILPHTSIWKNYLNKRSCIAGVVRQYSNETKSSSSEPSENDEKNLTRFQRFKKMYKEYWYVVLPVHIITSLGWFGGFYYLAMSGVDIPAFLEYLNFSESIVSKLRSSSMGYVAIAYALYKIVTPLRYAVTLGGSTFSIQYLKKWGYIKPIQAGQFKKMYLETKEGIKGKKDNFIVSVKSTKEGIKEKKDNIVSSVPNSRDNIKTLKEKVIRNTHSNDSTKS